MSTLEQVGLLQVGHDLIDQDHAEFPDLKPYTPIPCLPLFLRITGKA